MGLLIFNNLECKIIAVGDREIQGNALLCG